ncbi:MAG: hypothetical protein K6B74_09580 [Ruminococcus sp.]|nr:hypothetical protein [Ruminococcus sp.]
MKKILLCQVLAAAIVLAGCGADVRSSISEKRETLSSETVTSPTGPTSAGSAETSSPASAEPEQTASQTQVVTTTAITETVTSTELQTVQSETTAEEPPEAAPAYDTFYGVLIDEDCSDFEDPPLHDTPCMFMKECRESGYGLDIRQTDGSWVFYMFDENGQKLAWDYLNITQRQDGLFVSVTGTWENNVIKVISIEES